MEPGILSPTQYINADLPQLVEKLKIDYYDVITFLCKTAQKRALRLKDKEYQAPPQYVSSCNELFEEILGFIKLKKENLIPYLNSLSEKEAEDHDCLNCNSGKACNARHSMQLISLKESHALSENLLERLQKTALPTDWELTEKFDYEVLQIQIKLISNELTEFIFLENVYVIPKVIEAQKKINAQS